MATYQQYQLKDGKRKWQVKGYIGLDENGKKTFTTKRGFETKRQAEFAWAKLQLEFEENKHAPYAQMTFGEATEEWLNEYEKTVEESTLFKTEQLFKNHILPAFGERLIAEITPLDIQQQLYEWSTSYTKANLFMRYAGMVFDYAYRLDYIKENPTLKVRTIKTKQVEKKENFYNKDQLKLFMQALKDGTNKRAYVFFRLLAFTGMRKGELLALNWEDVDFECQLITIDKAVAMKETGWYIKAPKTKASIRTISLDDITINVLKDYQEACGNSEGLVFQSEGGGILSPAKPRKWYLQALKKTDLPPITIHGFRHTHCSLLFESGATLKDVQYRMGHSDIQTTMNIYSHVTSTAKERLANKFNCYVDF